MYKLHFLLSLFLLSHYVQAQVDREFIPCEVMPDMIVNYDADYKSLAITYIVENAPERRARFGKLYNDYLAKLNKVDFNSLPQECKVDYIFFKRDMNENLRLSKVNSKEYEKIKQWFPFADQIYELEQTHRKGTMPDAKKVALDLGEIKNQIEKLQSDLKADIKLNILSIYTADETITGLKTALESTYDFYNSYDPMFSWWVPIPYERLDKALTNYATEFKNKLKDPAFQQDNSGIVGRPVGKDELVRLLTYNYRTYAK